MLLKGLSDLFRYLIFNERVASRPQAAACARDFAMAWIDYFRGYPSRCCRGALQTAETFAPPVTLDASLLLNKLSPYFPCVFAPTPCVFAPTYSTKTKRWTPATHESLILLWAEARRRRVLDLRPASCSMTLSSSDLMTTGPPRSTGALSCALE